MDTTAGRCDPNARSVPLHCHSYHQQFRVQLLDKKRVHRVRVKYRKRYQNPWFKPESKRHSLNGKMGVETSKHEWELGTSTCLWKRRKTCNIKPQVVQSVDEKKEVGAVLHAKSIQKVSP